MRDPENIRAVASLPIDLMGFIFYEKSPRYVRNASVPLVPAHVRRVGVFVNAEFDFVVEKIKTHKLNYLQLHGDESPEYCRDIQNHPPTPSKGGDERVVPLQSGDEMKALSPKEENTNARSFSRSEKYPPLEGAIPISSPPLEGAQGVEYGGTGKKFNWQILQQYAGDTPFLLSGGIGAEDAEAVQKFTHPQFAGIDLNSKFELEPALKDVQKIENFLRVVVL